MTNRVTRSLVLYVCFVDRCVVCPSSIYADYPPLVSASSSFTAYLDKISDSRTGRTVAETQLE